MCNEVSASSTGQQHSVQLSTTFHPLQLSTTLHHLQLSTLFHHVQLSTTLIVVRLVTDKIICATTLSTNYLEGRHQLSSSHCVRVVSQSSGLSIGNGPLQSRLVGPGPQRRFQCRERSGFLLKQPSPI